MTTGLEGHRSTPSRRRTRRLDNGRGEGATPRDGAAAQGTADEGAYPGVRVSGRPDAARSGDVLAALDLGTNNCRLLVARPDGRGFKVIDAFSRIVRLGQGLSQSGQLTEDAIQRTIEALVICAAKMDRRRVTRFRAVATEACRRAGNGGDFLKRVVERTGLALEVITTEEEAALALAGCRPLFDPAIPGALVFDIGGGSTEIAWQQTVPEGLRVAAVSMPIGVVTLAERFGGDRFTDDGYEEMIAEVGGRLQAFERQHGIAAAAAAGQVQLVGTSGTVTTLAGVKLELTRYKRDRVDGFFLDVPETLAIGRRLAAMDFEERAAHPCIGRERADLVVAGCAILEAICRAWPVPRLRVADRGVREGILFGLMTQRS
jgi:exopolyphosphatase / guanosine-5'-triphosphate,3'-diphosphate pyrophosphatase